MSFTTDVVIGLEIHVQLNTATKLFCSCPTRAVEPNSSTCPVCLGHPGSKPVLNAKALDYATMLALALGCSINGKIRFSRKTYFYPDMGKNYQITQFEVPLAEGGSIDVGGKAVKIRRLHVEEDPAGIVREADCVLVDYNRSGIPLAEVVTEPDMTSPDEAREFIKRLMHVLSYIKIFDENDGVIKADANISVKESSYTRVEIKNITGAKEIERALLSELERQREAVRRGESIVQETRGWNPDVGVTYPQRLKESEDDYGYIADPDLPVFTMTPSRVDELRALVPELGADKSRRFVDQYGIDEVDAQVMAKERELGELFERVAKRADPVLSARWMRRELRRVLSESGKAVDQVSEDSLVDLIGLLHSKSITDRIGQSLMSRIVNDGISPAAVVKDEGLAVVSDSSAIKPVIDAIIAENEAVVSDYLSGQEKAFNFLIGQAMRKLKGRAAPAVINSLLKECLEAKR